MLWDYYYHQNYLHNALMMTNKNHQFSYRYQNQLIPSLINQIDDKIQTQEFKSLSKVKQDRKMHHSVSMSESRKKQSELRPLFNNKTKQGELLDKKNKLIPYVFIPKYKNETFIMPNRVFQKGKAGKRFYIKMRDTSSYSFRDQQQSQVQSAIRKQQKQKTIISRKVEQYNRIVDQNDGKIKAATNAQFFKNRRIFNYTKTNSDFFSQSQPMNQVKQPETLIMRKTNLAKTFDFSNKWRPNSRASGLFSKSGVRSMFHHRSQMSQHA